MFYTFDIWAPLLLKSRKPTEFGMKIAFLMRARFSSIVAGLFIATQSSGGSADAASKVGNWSGALVLELLGVVSLLNAVTPMFHQLAPSALLKSLVPRRCSRSRPPNA